MKHFGAALASYGSVALFHIAGITPEAQRLDDVVDPGRSLPTHDVGEADIRRFQRSYARRSRRSIWWCSRRRNSAWSRWRRSPACSTDGARRIPLLVVTSPQVKPDADRMGLTARIEAAGGTVLSGMCFYQSYAREMAEANGWKRLATNSAKLINILGGYGYQPALMSMAACVDAACAGGQHRAMTQDFFAAAGMGRKMQGHALVAKDGFSARYDLDRVRGVFSRPEHKLAGESYVGRVLVLDAAKGGVATAWMLHEMTARGVVPAALVLNAVNPIMVQGAALADFTMISGFDLDITQAIPNGALVEVDPTGERPFIRLI